MQTIMSSMYMFFLLQAVTPYQTRKRVLSSGSALDTNNPRLAAMKIGNNSREGRSLSYSPGLDVTASLPVSRLALAVSSCTCPV